MFSAYPRWTRFVQQFRANSSLSRALKDASSNVSKKSAKKVAKQTHQLLRRSNQNDTTVTQSVITSLLMKNNHKNVEPSELVKFLKPVTSVTVGEQIDLEKVSDILMAKKSSYEVLVADEVITWTLKTGKQIMVLANGTLVGWDLTETEMAKKYIPTVMDAVVEQYIPESEEMDYVEIQASSEELGPGSFVQGDVLVIQGENKNQKQLEMAAFAVGLSRSTRLLILEESLERHIQMTRDNSEALLKGLRIKTTESDILRSTGRLFLLRGKLNLYSELIETPDMYWSEPTLEKIYEAVSKRLDIQLRISIMNRKLDYITEEQRALLSVLNEKKGTRLEWIIIVLIMVEVCFETVHFVEKW